MKSFLSCRRAVLCASLLPLALACHAAPALRVVGTSASGTPLLKNGGFETVSQGRPQSWNAWQRGFLLSPRQGRGGSSAILCERSENGPEFGASQSVSLNRTNVVPLVIRGYSRAERVSGSPDSGYSLYVDLVYSDGTELWGRNVPFACGTHDWQRREFVLLPEKPVKSVAVYCLFRGHTGKAWFDDVSAEEIRTPAGAVLLHGVAVERPKPAGATALPAAVETHRTSDALEAGFAGGLLTSVRMGGRELAGVGPGGFLARDVAAGSDFYGFTNGACPELGLSLETRIEDASNHIAVSGRLRDNRGKDRAITLLFAVPIGSSNWHWGDDVRTSRPAAGQGEFVHSVNVRSGAASRMSRYPLGAIWNEQAGLGLGLDMAHPSQYTILHHGGLSRFCIAYDFGLARDTLKHPGGADFRFVLFGFDPAWGFRSALAKYYAVFPAGFIKRAKNEGTWMPFTDISRVPQFRDFGFAFQEGAPNVPFDDTNGIASFVYVEPMSHWLALPAETPRTYGAALDVLRKDAAGARDAEKRRMAAATLTSGIHTADGQLALYLVKAPWCDGGVFTLNPDPDLGKSGAGAKEETKASVMREAIDKAFSRHPPPPGGTAPGPGLDGVYLDSLEMSAPELNYRREHFKHADVPLVFDSEGRPCQLMMFNTFEFARDLAADLHSRGRLCFANAALWNYSFPAPILDVMGTEVNWLREGAYAPDSDAVMNFRRALCGQKPYCLLMNTDYTRFTPDLVERYFQRCLFYGVWPGFFDQEAASKDPYWASERRWYDRDRALFKKYIPLLREVTRAGWEPVTGARCSNPQLWLERFGASGRNGLLLAVLNASDQPQEGVVTFEPEFGQAFADAGLTDLVTGGKIEAKGGRASLALKPHQTVVLKRPPE